MGASLRACAALPPNHPHILLGLSCISGSLKWSYVIEHKDILAAELLPSQDRRVGNYEAADLVRGGCADEQLVEVKEMRINDGLERTEAIAHL